MVNRSVTRFMFAAAMLAALAACGSQGEPDDAAERTPELSASSGPQVVADTPAHPGQVAFIQCASCHAVTPGAAAKVGPNLHGVVGRAAGVDENYVYSDALMQSGIVWDRAALDAFIANPNTSIPGTKMVYLGLSDAQQRALIIDYLESQSQ